ncbi:hypothetical protein OG331_47695 [Streptomyces sp. NBC_01017]|uniref:hypothetical protein n=1 Tax=Streptomyces sp. NBC_01017 TaxID=2903721 RepID=UPI003866BBF4|nr:hypothetical protein OG331_04285 [Streptomyces sp. NBC_01017]WSV34751.1 hypothetical protein OG331_47695 [Streptomyces sp. NBC_01017]
MFGQSATSEEQLWNALNELGAVEEWTGQGVTEQLGNDALRVLRDVADSYGITAAGNEDLASVVVAHLAAQAAAAAGPPTNNPYTPPPTTAPPPYTSAGIGDDRQLLQWCIDYGYARSPYQQVRAGVMAQWQYETQEIDGWLLGLAARFGLSTVGVDADGLWQAIVASSTPAADDMPAGGRGDGADDQVMADAPAREAAAPWQWSTRDKEILLSFLNGADLDLGLAEPTLDGLQEHLDAHYAAAGDGPRPADTRTWLAGAFRNSTFVTEQLVPAATSAGLPAPTSTEDLPAYLYQAWTLLRASRWTDADEQTLQDFLQPYSHPQPGGPRPAPTLKTLHTYLTARLQPPPAKAGPWIHNARRYSSTAHTIINTHPDNAPTPADNATAWLTYLTNPTQPPTPAPPPALPQIPARNIPQHPAPATGPDTGPPAPKRRRTGSGSAPAVDLATVDAQAVQDRLDRLSDYQRWIVSGLLHGHDPAQIGTYRIYYTGPEATDTAAPAHTVATTIQTVGEALGLSTAPETLLNDLRVLGIQDPGTYHGAHYEALHAVHENDATYIARANAIAADPASPHRWYLSAVLHGDSAPQITRTLRANGTPKNAASVDRGLDRLSRALGMPAHYTPDTMRAKLLELQRSKPGAINDPGLYTTADRDLDTALLDDATIAERANRLAVGTDDRLRLILSAALSGENIDTITRTLQRTRTRGTATYTRTGIEKMLRDLGRDLGRELGLKLTPNQVRLKIHSLKDRITDPGTYDTTERNLADTLHTDDTTVNNTLTLTNPLHRRTLQAALDNATIPGVQTALGYTTVHPVYNALKKLGNALGLNDTGAGVLATIQRLRDRINTARNQN